MWVPKRSTSILLAKRNKRAYRRRILQKTDEAKSISTLDMLHVSARHVLFTVAHLNMGCLGRKGS